MTIPSELIPPWARSSARRVPSESLPTTPIICEFDERLLRFNATFAAPPGV
jgi:hypothetical protein